MGLFVKVKVRENLGPGALAEDRVCDFGIRNAEFENRKLGFEEFVVIGVGADPEPDHGVAGHGAEGAVAGVDAGGPEGFDFLEAKGAVVGMFDPEAVLLAGFCRASGGSWW
jgi:hypothetical protein